MSQPYTRQQVRRVISLGIKAGGAWLMSLGIFAGLLWLSAWMHETPPAAEKPVERARASGPDRPAQQQEHAEPAREDPFPDLPLPYDAECPWQTAPVLPYRPVMTTPVFISGDPLQYPPEARAAGIQGLVIARCTITCRGKVKSCRIIKGRPFMDQAVITTLESRRYTPVTFEGRPLTVSYNFVVQIPER